ncbi:hypothetical protein SMSP2_01059 [Limihaloglobus sulfuriphilus]|uniref:Uncharacterized protein n=1 Tax=Limihaloglobus sulfuriphilus TaxID=1851148 RepID=A0A1Q2MDD9_9BACT|nr:hypothetical protein [Limihaloglobus sulfuriphilus]AQQ70701.1 hypothetical protein SMSP2_01059 [Limihaloglobus sulfuriphilus]
MNKNEKPKSLKFQYLKADTYVTYHVDGVFGGITPKGMVHMDVFTEKFPTPSCVSHELTGEGKLGKEIDRVVRDGVIRELQAGMVMDLMTARQLRDWLSAKIDEAVKRRKPPESEL